MRVLTLLLLAACNKSDGNGDTDGTAPDGPDADGDGSPDNADCDDENPLVRPGIDEACDGVDTDCDSTTGEDGLASVNGTSGSDLQAILDAAAAGDEVTICAGTYPGPVFLPSGVTIRGVGGSPAVTITGGAGSTVSLSDAEIGGITVSGGAHGLDVTDGAAVLLTDVTITGCDAGGDDGGGILVGANAQVTLDRSTVSGNTAARGAGVSLGNGATLTLTESFIEENTATDLGGGVLVGSSAAITGGTIRDNIALRGAGLGLLGDATVASMFLSLNTASALGGGIFANGGSLSLTDVLVSGNIADPPDQEITEGGGIYADGTAISLAGDTTITLNLAVVGGGLALHGASTVTGGDVVGNIGLIQGGGIYVDSSGAAVGLCDVVIEDNGGTVSGGGLHVVAGDVTGTNVVFTGNNGGALGGGMALEAATSVTLTGGEITSNEATAGGGVAMLGMGGDASNLVCTDVLFGQDATDNLPNDLQVGADSYTPNGTTTISCVSDRGCQ
jgi:hypothetical protein